MERDPLLFQCLLFIFLMYYSTYFTSTHAVVEIPRLSPILRDTILYDPVTWDAKTYADTIQTLYYEQVLDHFNYRPESYKTFRQRYMMNSKYWGGAISNSPIIAYLGAEEPIDNSPESMGFLNDNAASFKALLVYIEVFLIL